MLSHQWTRVALPPIRALGSIHFTMVDRSGRWKHGLEVCGVRLIDPLRPPQIAAAKEAAPSPVQRVVGTIQGMIEGVFGALGL